MINRTDTYLNNSTRLALIDTISGYVNKQISYRSDFDEIINEHGHSEFFRFDLGENCDGYSPLINKLLSNENLLQNLNEYPDVTHLALRKQIAEIYEINSNEIVLSTGLDSVLDLITKVFFNKNDVYLMAIPEFFLFENYSERMGAAPAFVRLSEENNFKWDEKVLERFNHYLVRVQPKLIWVSNPGNPTGLKVDDCLLLSLIDIASRNNTFVVLDEAYGEYIGGPDKSFAKYIHKYKNLLVLRTFSKAYGLAGIRLGFLMTSSKTIIQAMLLHRYFFPITQFALNIAKIALTDQGFIKSSVIKLHARKKRLFTELEKLENLKLIRSESNIFMMKHQRLNMHEFDQELKLRGILASKLDQSGINHLNYLRFTVRTKDENEKLVDACKKINAL